MSGINRFKCSLNGTVEFAFTKTTALFLVFYHGSIQKEGSHCFNITFTLQHNKTVQIFALKIPFPHSIQQFLS